MFGIVDMIANGLKAFNNVFQWKTGGRSKEDNTERSDGEKAHDQFTAAMDAHDSDGANRARDEQRSVRDKAAASE